MAQHQPTTGAGAVTRTLAAGGVEVVFCNPGTTEMCLVDAFDDVASTLRTILCPHETVCTGAADGYARMANKPAATLLHLGVGLANGSANLHNARRAASPVINLVGTMATWHETADPLLASDVRGLAAFSGCFYAPPDPSPDALSDAVADALLAVRDFRAGESRVRDPRGSSKDGIAADARGGDVERFRGDGSRRDAVAATWIFL